MAASTLLSVRSSKLMGCVGPTLLRGNRMRGCSSEEPFAILAFSRSVRKWSAAAAAAQNHPFMLADVQPATFINILWNFLSEISINVFV